MSAPSAIAATSSAVYVVERVGMRAQKFDLSGIWSSAWGRGVHNARPGGAGVCTVAGNCLSGTAGALGGEFNAPRGIAPLVFGSLPGVSVANAGNGRVEVFERDCSGSGGGCTSFTTSTTHHRYDV